MEICNTFLYYHVEKFPAYRLIEKEFLLTFVQKGHLIAKSLFQWNDVDQAIELNSSGKLKLSVDKDLYQELGLNGVPSFMLGKVPTKYSKIFICKRFCKLISNLFIFYSNYNRSIES